MNWKRIGRAALCLLVVCCLVLNMSPIEARAIDPITIGMGIFAGVGALLGIGSIMIALGVQPKPTTAGRNDFWNLADRVYAGLPESIKTAFFIETVVGGQVKNLMKAWYYNDRYYFSEHLIQAINTFLYTGTVVVDTNTGVVSSTAPIQVVPDFSSDASVAASYATCMTYVYQELPDLYYYLSTAPYCTVISGVFDTQIWFTEKEPNTDNGSFYYHWDSYRCLQLQSDGSWKSVVAQYPAFDPYDIYCVSSHYRTNFELALGNVGSNVIPFPGSGLNVEDDVVDGVDDSGKKYPVFIPPTASKVETMLQDEAQSENKAEAGVGVDLSTGGYIDPYFSPVEVGVDVTTAVASILIALGISPAGDSNSDFRTLVNNIVASLPADFLYDYDSLATGSMQMLRCWLYDGTYYVTEDLLVYINDLLYNGSDTMNPIFVFGEFPVDKSVYTNYLEACTFIDSKRSSTSSYSQRLVSTFDNSTYLCAVFPSAQAGAFYAFSDQPIKFEQSGNYFNFYVTGNYFTTWLYEGAVRCNDPKSLDGSYALFRQDWHSPPTYVVNYAIYERGRSVVGALNAVGSSEDLSDLNYGYYTVKVDGVAVNYYPLKLFETLEEAESATQDEVQAGLNSSTSVTVDTSTGTIVDVLPGIGEGEVPEETIPVVVPPGTGSGTDTGTSSGSVSADVLENTLQGHRSDLLNGLKAFFEWLASAIVSGFRKVIEWLSDTLLVGLQSKLEWLSATLLEPIDAWLTEIISGILAIPSKILEGIRAIFVPSTDYLTTKVEALRARFAFADSIISTGEVIGLALNDFNTSPPIIYMELGNAESQYDWGGTAIALDLRWYERYKPTVDRLLSALLWIFFAWRVFRKLPGIISGMEGDSSFAPVSDGRFGGYSSNLPRLGSGSMKRRN